MFFAIFPMLAKTFKKPSGAPPQVSNNHQETVVDRFFEGFYKLSGWQKRKARAPVFWFLGLQARLKAFKKPSQGRPFDGFSKLSRARWKIFWKFLSALGKWPEEIFTSFFVKIMISYNLACNAFHGIFSEYLLAKHLNMLENQNELL